MNKIELGLLIALALMFLIAVTFAGLYIDKSTHDGIQKSDLGNIVYYGIDRGRAFYIALNYTNSSIDVMDAGYGLKQQPVKNVDDDNIVQFDFGDGVEVPTLFRHNGDRVSSASVVVQYGQADQRTVLLHVGGMADLSTFTRTVADQVSGTNC